MTDSVIFRTDPVSLMTNTVIFLKNQVIFLTNPVIFRTNPVIQGVQFFLPPSQKTEYQTWGEGKKQSQRTPPMSGTLFFWGVAGRIRHPVYRINPVTFKKNPVILMTH